MVSRELLKNASESHACITQTWNLYSLLSKQCAANIPA